MVFIYILKLKENKYYVGKTSNPKFRLNQHFDSYGSTWTKKYQPIKVIKLIPNCDNFDEDKYTKIYMNKYGIRNVRGGTFCQMKLDSENINTIQKELNGATDKCYKCGEPGHFASQCDEISESEDEYDCWVCCYCGKEFETQKGATMHENKYCKQKYETFGCQYCGKEFETQKGATFHENIYCKKKKYNKYNNKRRSYY